jgi:hypothetical protein
MSTITEKTLTPVESMNESIRKFEHLVKVGNLSQAVDVARSALGGALDALVAAAEVPEAHVELRAGGPGEDSYGYVYFGDSNISVGFTTGPDGPLGGRGDIWQANWETATPAHFSAAAKALIEAGILIPRDGNVAIEMDKRYESL